MNPYTIRELQVSQCRAIVSVQISIILPLQDPISDNG